MKPTPLHRSNRYRIQTKQDRHVQQLLESRRSRVSFTTRCVPPPTMTPYTCDACHLAFASTWLDHCPSCGNRAITVTHNLNLAN
jgi:lipopolysaccharide biosynthesis regulator YciM